MPNYEKGFYKVTWNTGESYTDNELTFDEKKDARDEFNNKIKQLRAFPKLRVDLWKINRAGMQKLDSFHNNLY